MNYYYIDCILKHLINCYFLFFISCIIFIISILMAERFFPIRKVEKYLEDNNLFFTLLLLFSIIFLLSLVMIQGINEAFYYGSNDYYETHKYVSFLKEINQPIDKEFYKTLDDNEKKVIIEFVKNQIRR